MRSTRVPRPMAALSFALALLALPGRPAVADEPSLDRAEKAYRTGRYTEALEALRGAGKGEDARAARALRARVLLETGAYAKAEVEGRALLEESGSLEARLILAEVLQETGRYAAARELLDEALQAAPDHVRARRLRFEVAELQGDAVAKERGLDYFFELYNQDRAHTAEALTAVARVVEDEDPQGAWQAYNEAHEKDPDHLEAYLLAGLHALDKYALPLAREELEAALKRNPHHPLAHAVLGAVWLSDGETEKAAEAVEKALAANPHLGVAHLVRSQVLAVEERYAESLASIQAALGTNPEDVEALALLAAHHATLGEAEARDAALERAGARPDRRAAVLVAIGHALERQRRYADALSFARRALEADPEGWEPAYLAAMNLLRLGEEAEGYALLERAFAANDFNVRAYNTLTVLDRDVKQKAFVEHRTRAFHVKIDAKDDALLWPYLEPLLDPLYDRLCERYDARPVGPKQYDGRLLLLFFSDHGEFSARTTGLPGLHATGACFGPVITMPTPRFAMRERRGTFNWARVLEHELAHTMTLAKSRHRIPRWLGEGISDWQEEDPHLTLDQLLVDSFAAGRLLPLAGMTRGFQRPSFPGQVPLSYYHASLFVDDLVRREGFGPVRGLVAAYAEGGRAEEVLPKALGTPLEEIEARFQAMTRSYVERLGLEPTVDDERVAALEAAAKERPDDPGAQAALAAARLAKRQKDEANEAAERALAKDPQQGLARYVLGALALAKGEDLASARAHLEAARAADPRHAPTREALAALARKENKPAEAIVELEALLALRPRLATGEGNPYETLAALCEEAGDDAKAIETLQRLRRLNPEAYQARLALARLFEKQGRPGDAVDLYTEAFHIQLYDAPAHLAAARAAERAGRPKEALREYGVLSALEPKSAAGPAGVSWLAACAAVEEAQDL